MGLLDPPALTPSRAGYGTKSGVYATGTAGTTTTYTATSGAGTVRLVVRLPVSTTKWRIKIRNYSTATGATQSSVAGQGVRLGTTALANDGAETGNALGSALTPVVASGYTIPGDGTWFTSAWITSPSLQFTANTLHMVAHGFDAGASITLPRGVGQAWVFTDYSGGLDGSEAASSTPNSNTPFEVQVEYEWVGNQKIGLFLGDSITEGLGGSSSLGNLPSLSWPALWAARNNAVAANIAVSGATASAWQTAGNAYWNRVDLSRIAPDFMVLDLGANDANSGTSLGTYQSQMIAVAANMRAQFGDKPLYLTNVTPRSLGTTNEAIRASYNNWLEALPMRALACFDFDSAVRDPAVTTQLLGAPTSNNIYSYDGTHFTRRGYNKLAQTVGRLAA